MSRLIFTSSFLLAFCATAQTAWSAVSNAGVNLPAQDSVIVTATRSEQNSIDIPANIVVIDAQAIENSGAKNLADVLRSRAGIQVQDVVGTGARGTTLVMRGFGTNAANNTLILLDGQKLNFPTLAGPDLSSIALADIDRIEILQGSAGVLFGDQATGGVINIITKQPGKRAATLEAGRGTLDWESYRGSVSEGFDNGFGYRLSGEKQVADNYRINNNSGYSNVNLSTGYARDKLHIFAEAQHVDDDLRLAGSLSPQEIAQNRRQTDTPDDFTDRDTDRYRLGTSIPLASQWQFAVEYSYRNTASKGITFDTPFTDNVRTRGLTPRLLGNFATPYGDSIVTLGYDQQRSDYRSTLTFADINQDINDFYGQIVQPVYKDVKLTLGARHSRLNESNHVSDLHSNDSKTVGEFGVSWQITGNARVFARRDTGFRWANADENGFTLPGIDFLKPQTSKSNELGFEWHASRLQASVVFYHIDTNDELLFDPLAGSFGANINLPKSRRDGINTDWQWAATDQLQLIASAGYVDAKIRAGDFQGETVPFVARYTGSVGIDWQILSSIDFYVDAQYTGQRYRSGDDGNNLGQLGGYTIYNANLRWQQNNWYTSVRANNLFAKEYNGFTGSFLSGDTAVVFAYPAAKRQLFFTVGYKF
jgi:iron complex outermembrane receptor protein